MVCFVHLSIRPVNIYQVPGTFLAPGETTRTRTHGQKWRWTNKPWTHFDKCHSSTKHRVLEHIGRDNLDF